MNIRVVKEAQVEELSEEIRKERQRFEEHGEKKEEQVICLEAELDSTQCQLEATEARLRETEDALIACRLQLQHSENDLIRLQMLDQERRNQLQDKDATIRMLKLRLGERGPLNLQDDYIGKNHYALCDGDNMRPSIMSVSTTTPTLLD